MQNVEANVYKFAIKAIYNHNVSIQHIHCLFFLINTGTGICVSSFLTVCCCCSVRKNTFDGSLKAHYNNDGAKIDDAYKGLHPFGFRV